MSEKKVLVSYHSNNKVVKLSKPKELLSAIKAELGSIIPPADLAHL